MIEAEDIIKLRKMQNLDLSKLNMDKDQLATLKNVQSVLAKLNGSRRRSCKNIGGVLVSPLIGRLTPSHSLGSSDDRINVEKDRRCSADLGKEPNSNSSMKQISKA